MSAKFKVATSTLNKVFKSKVKDIRQGNLWREQVDSQKPLDEKLDQDFLETVAY